MKVIAMIMAGGESQALCSLTSIRSEPSIPFAGKYRIIDFPLSNCVNSGIFNVGVLTQYMPRSLNDHIGVGKPWDLDRSKGGIRLLQPYLGRGISGWQHGTADSIRRNLEFIDEQRVDTILILAGDHVYRMDYRPMLRHHQEHNADVTLAVRQVSPFETHRFGMVAVDDDGRATDFEEKPKRTRETLASMGIYVFKYKILREKLLGDNVEQIMDFGRDLMPALVKEHLVTTYTFEGYWADIGTLQSYWEANISLLSEGPALDLYDPEWIIHTRSEERPPAKLGKKANVRNSLLSNGCIIEGTVERSVISPGVYIAEGASVRDSIVMNDSLIESGAVLERAILDKDVRVGKEAIIGYGDDNTPNKGCPEYLNTGLSLIGKGASIPPLLRIGRNVQIHPRIKVELPKDKLLPSGSTL